MIDVKHYHVFLILNSNLKPLRSQIVRMLPQVKLHLLERLSHEISQKNEK